jgi:twitching motility protein PilT
MEERAVVDNFFPVQLRRGGSDLHLKVGRPPVIRVNGDLHDTSLAVLRPEDIKRCSEQTLSPKQRDSFAERKELDCAHGVQAPAPFRTQILQQPGPLGTAPDGGRG